MTPLQHSRYYHIYNRGINSGNLFLSANNYKYFMELYAIYIEPIADTLAWCLMKNHFHFLVRIKDEHEIGYLNPLYAKTNDKTKKWKTVFPTTQAEQQTMQTWKKPDPSTQFAHLFNAYTKAFNQEYTRTGGLLEEPFERKLVDDEKYLKNLILYINQNPVHHGVLSHAVEYPWSSYLTVVSIKPTRLNREAIVGWFDGEANFKALHGQLGTFDDIVHYIIEKD